MRVVWILALTAATAGGFAYLGRGGLAGQWAQQPAQPAEMCRIGWVYDGDTVELKCGAGSEAARVVGLDTPETKRAKCNEEFAAGKAATEALRGLIDEAKVSYVVKGRDKYQRPLIQLFVDKEDVAPIMVKSGHAVAYTGGSRPDWCAKLAASES